MEMRRFLKRFLFAILMALTIYALLKGGMRLYSNFSGYNNFLFYVLNGLNLIFIGFCLTIIFKKKGFIRAAFIFFMISEIFKTISDTSFDI